MHTIKLESFNTALKNSAKQICCMRKLLGIASVNSYTIVDGEIKCLVNDGEHPLTC